MYVDRHAAAAYDLIHAVRGKDYRAEATQVVAEIQRRLPGATSLLDVACGTGLHLAAFAELGLVVAGVERSATMLEAARARLPSVPLYEGDMQTFDLARESDAVVCLFSAIGYMTTIDELRRAAVRMAAHLSAGGVLAVEPWFGPDEWAPDTLHADCAKGPDLAVARVSRSGLDGSVSTIDMRYVVATPEGTDTFSELHRMGLFRPAEYRDAFEAAGLAVEHDVEGLTGRGLFIGTKTNAA
jgi:SAM-dependent methyltransferase